MDLGSETDAVLQIMVEEDTASGWLETITDPSAVPEAEVTREVASLTQKLEPGRAGYPQVKGPGRKKKSKKNNNSNQANAGKMQTHSKQSGNFTSGRIQLYSASGEKFQDFKLKYPKSWTEIASVKLGVVPDHPPFRLWSTSQVVERVLTSNLVGCFHTRLEGLPNFKMCTVVYVYTHEDGLWAVVQAVSNKTVDMPSVVCYLSAEGIYEISDPISGVSAMRESIQFPRGDVIFPRYERDEKLDAGGNVMQQRSANSLPGNPSAPALHTKEWFMQAMEGFISEKMKAEPPVPAKCFPPYPAPLRSVPNQTGYHGDPRYEGSRFPQPGPSGWYSHGTHK